MVYVDGFVLPVPKRKLAAYRKMARVSAKVWMEHGALSLVECIADDVKPGKYTSFPQSVKLKAGEVVAFGWVTYTSRKSRDIVMAKVAEDKRMQKYHDLKTMPFDGRRLIFGGFKAFIEASRKRRK
jgi:uncharacterized protein YbaA (DUF1428 family)